MSTSALDESVTQYACEIDLECESGWTRYVDNGSEGQDSCVWNPAPGEPTTSWSAAANTCPSGSHLASIMDTEGITNGLAQVVLTLSEGSWTFVGCLQDSATSSIGTGWYWADGTPADNLLCDDYQTGCGIWAANQPE